MSNEENEFFERLKKAYQPDEPGLSEASFRAGVDRLVERRRRRQRAVLGLILVAAVGGSLIGTGLITDASRPTHGFAGSVTLDVETPTAAMAEDEFLNIYEAWNDVSGHDDFEVDLVAFDVSSDAEDKLDELWTPELAAISDLIYSMDI